MDGVVKKVAVGEENVNEIHGWSRLQQLMHDRRRQPRVIVLMREVDKQALERQAACGMQQQIAKLESGEEKFEISQLRQLLESMLQSGERLR